MIRKLTALLLVVAFISSLIAPSVHAADTSMFQAGRIIDDGVFTNVNTMSVTDIQNFLNSKVPTCDTNHAGTVGGTGTAYNPPWICLKDFYENPSATYSVSFSYLDTSCNSQTGSRTYYYNNDYQYTSLTPIYSNGDCRQGYSLKATIQNINGVKPSGAISAAQIIYNLAQQYQINPQVLITLLQKEQGLVTDTWPAPWQYQSATGYGCPDYVPCSAGYSGFSNQLTQATKMFRAILNQSPTWYSPYVLGNNSIQWSPIASCGSATVNIQNLATVALYDYTPYQPNAAALAAGYGTGDTCSSYGNRNFWLYYNDWFGSTYNYIPPTCSAKLSSIACVWHLNHAGSDADFLTASTSERDTAISSSNYIYNDSPFYTLSTQLTGTIPVYRIRLPNEHFYTTSTSERDTLLANSQNIYEGIAFYVYPSNSATNASYPVYRLVNNTGHRFVSSASERDNLISQGYTYEGVAFNAPSGFMSAQDPSPNYQNIYRLANSNSGHLYTASLSEADSLLRNGWMYEGVLLQAPVGTTSTPIYRLYNSNGDHVFTPSSDEKAALVNSGWTYEGIGWYIDNTTPQTYRFYVNGGHFYTTNLNEAFQVASSGGRYESIGFGYNQEVNISIHRLRYGSYHFFTGDVNEALQAANNGWTYEGIGWYASQTTTSNPVYRLVNGYQHFYTVSASERDLLINNGWTYEGIGWYGL